MCVSVIWTDSADSQSLEKWIETDENIQVNGMGREVENWEL